MSQTKKPETFLADAVKPQPKHLSYQDGFRFGVGFFIGNLLLATVLGGLVFAALALTHRL